MENPEEILHSLEEFAKMKPKDIPRELEEYLKFVAKTGDPVYQWSAIKSLFREKLINVITEFYESCSSMEIPPCPNVEMFNYDLMKNFILEKLDTFASAPFTLQRICELLTSPRKEYSRIDKYMRALEKNILVVSTMEPGGRRTENGDGVMNGIESDHEHVPEPGNEINVEEMDDSPSWPQNIQTTNHISEPISFDNPEQEYHVSTSNQEIVCVQYVSVEPLASEGLQIQSEEVKESDISVTITALNDKKENENQGEASIPEPESQLAVDIPIEVTETPTKQEIETEIETKMDIQTPEPTENTVKDTKHIDNSEVSPDTLSADISSTISEKPSQEPDQVHAISLELDTAETESVSPETSVTSSENSPSESNAPTDTSSNDHNIENSVSSTPEASDEKLESQAANRNQILETDSPGDVDSSTKISEDEEVNKEEKEADESNMSEVAIPELESKEEPLSGKEPEKAEIDSSPVSQVTFQTETSKVPAEVPEIEPPSESSAQQERPQSEEVAETTTEEITESKELAELKSEVPVEKKSEEILLNPDKKEEEKETPMDVDVVPEDSSDANEKDKATSKEPEMSEPPV